jgi:hypothetical protein
MPSPTHSAVTDQGKYDMSEIGVNYKATISPKSVRVGLRLGFVGRVLKVTITEVGDFVAVLEPSGNVAEIVMSAVIYPIAQTVGLVLPALGKSLIVGQTVDLVTVDPSVQTVGGERITVDLQNPRVSNFNGALMLDGDLVIS